MASNELKPEPLSSPTRILHIITDLSVAGAEMKLYKLLAASDKDRFSHAVLSMRSQGGLREPIIALGVPVYSLGITRTLPNAMSIVRFIRLVWWLRPHLIHGWMYHGNLAAHVAGAIAPSKPIVLWSIHQSLYSFAFEKRLTALVIRLGARISEKVNRIVYVSKASASQHEAVGYARSKSAVVHYGFDTEKFRPSTEARERVRRELGVPRDTLLIG
ncbi:MAG TPA: glycosyltransferase, partial [Pyrinomonadaceae bacterium]|nr:glycosyltransferase [Pyrinomonadaceae bacterium]